jgi:hypothetical protein
LIDDNELTCGSNTWIEVVERKGVEVYAARLNLAFRHPRLQFGWLLEFRTDLAVKEILPAALVALLLRRSEVPCCAGMGGS